MLTKEECLKALDYIEEETTYVEDYETMPLITCNHLQKEISILRQLINEHFDNSPLKFEELKPKMWVWDVKNAEWVCIDRPIANVSYCKNLSGLVIFFEENRFYRKQVEE